MSAFIKPSAFFLTRLDPAKRDPPGYIDIYGRYQ